MKYESTILIVDDQASSRAVLKGLLRKEYNLAFATNGLEALQIASQVMPDLILLDVMMPIMNGFEVCQRVRASPLLAEVPILMITALDDRASRLRAIQAGADDLITKPFDHIELRTRVRTITKLNRYRRLHTEQAKFKWVVEKADDGYLMISPDDTILYANAQARHYLALALDEKELLGCFLELVKKQYRCEPQAAWSSWPALPEEVSPIYLVRPESESSQSLWLQVELMKISPPANEGYLVYLRDVTASVAADRVMWAFHEQISHKLRTPLTGLTMFLELLQDNLTNLSEDDQIFLSSAYQNALSLRDEIEDIFKYLSSTEIAKSGEEREGCCLAEIAPIVGELRKFLILSDIKISLDVTKEPTKTYLALSRRAIEMILRELLENSKKFHPQQSPHLELHISDSPIGISIQVRDDGITLSPDELAKMWMPYYQVEKYFTGQVAGMGLGLSMIAALIWEAGGSYRAYNRTTGKGIVVEIMLPVTVRGRIGGRLPS